jgi:dTDP-glucose 4,6-dehydratase
VNVLITGAAGFVGSHLVDAYLNHGDRVLAIDNFITGEAENLAQARRSSNLQFLEMDVTRFDEIPRNEVVATFGVPELILHFASPASPIDYANRPLETMRVNSLGTERCCEAALQWNARLLLASTSECYGDPLVHPQPESYWGNVNPVGPRSCYDESKRYGEALVSAFIRVHDIDARIIRIFNTYGPRMRLDDGRVVPNFVGQALRGEPLTIYGTGAQTRSFCYVSDLIEGIYACAASDRTRGLVVNLGNPQERTIREFAEAVSRIAHVELRLDETTPLPVDDPTRRCPDITLAKTLLGWSPQVNLDAGLRETIQDFSRRLQGAALQS